MPYLPGNVPMHFTRALNDKTRLSHFLSQVPIIVRTLHYTPLSLLGAFQSHFQELCFTYFVISCLLCRSSPSSVCVGFDKPCLYRICRILNKVAASPPAHWLPSPDSSKCSYRCECSWKKKKAQPDTSHYSPCPFSPACRPTGPLWFKAIAVEYVRGSTGVIGPINGVRQV